MSLTDAKSALSSLLINPLKSPIPTVCICWSSRVAHVTGISSTVLTVKNPALRWVPILSSPCLMRDSSVKVSVKCWR
ncbi:Uncharacterised protein [Klebsiella quasivariicola]|nr:Uncharacterised protein [Klebsiella quasivariicola]